MKSKTKREIINNLKAYFNGIIKTYLGIHQIINKIIDGVRAVMCFIYLYIILGCFLEAFLIYIVDNARLKNDVFTTPAIRAPVILVLERQLPPGLLAFPQENVQRRVRARTDGTENVQINFQNNLIRL